MKKLIIDRFEGNFVVCELEDKSFTDTQKNKLPLEIKEGDCLIEDDGVYIIDIESTKQRKKAIEDKFKKMFSK